MKYFSKNLEFLRKSKGLKQTEIVDFIGIEQTQWSNYEKGKSFPNLNLFHKICNYFMINEGDLLNKDLSNVHLNEKIVSLKTGESVHLNVHPSVHLNAFSEEGEVYKVNRCDNCQVLHQQLQNSEVLVSALQQSIKGYIMAANALQLQVTAHSSTKKRAC